MSTETTPVEGVILDSEEVVAEAPKRNWRKTAIIGTVALLGAAVVYRLAAGSSKKEDDNDSEANWQPAPSFDETSTTI